MTSPKRMSRQTGILYLSLLPFGVFSFVIVPAKLFVQGNISLTISNIIENEWLFRLSTISHLISQILVVLLALSVLRLFKNVNRNLAILMMVFMLLVVPISFLNEVHNLAVLKLTNDNSSVPVDQLHTYAALLLDMSRNGVLIAQIFWGLSLLPLGWLVIKSGFLPKLIGIAVLIGGLGYLFDSFTQLLMPGFVLISRFTFILEIVLPIWLLAKGVNETSWKNVVHQTRSTY